MLESDTAKGVMKFNGKILEETLRTALWCKENSRSNDEMVRKRKLWDNRATADQLQSPKASTD